MCRLQALLRPQPKSAMRLEETFRKTSLNAWSWPGAVFGDRSRIADPSPNLRLSIDGFRRKLGTAGPGQLRPVVKRPATDCNKRIADLQIVRRNSPYTTRSGPSFARSRSTTIPRERTLIPCSVNWSFRPTPAIEQLVQKGRFDSVSGHYLSERSGDTMANLSCWAC